MRLKKRFRYEMYLWDVVVGQERQLSSSVGGAQQCPSLYSGPLSFHCIEAAGWMVVLDRAAEERRRVK